MPWIPFLCETNASKTSWVHWTAYFKLHTGAVKWTCMINIRIDVFSGEHPFCHGCSIIFFSFSLFFCLYFCVIFFSLFQLSIFFSNNDCWALDTILSCVSPFFRFFDLIARGLFPLPQFFLLLLFFFNLLKSPCFFHLGHLASNPNAVEFMFQLLKNKYDGFRFCTVVCSLCQIADFALNFISLYRSQRCKTFNTTTMHLERKHCSLPPTPSICFVLRVAFKTSQLGFEWELTLR